MAWPQEDRIGRSSCATVTPPPAHRQEGRGRGGGGARLTSARDKRQRSELYCARKSISAASLSLNVVWGRRHRKSRPLVLSHIYFSSDALTPNPTHLPSTEHTLSSLMRHFSCPVDEGMPNGPSIFAYLVFAPGGTSAEGIAMPIKVIVWRGPGVRLGVQCKTRRTRPSRIRTCLGFIQTASICNWLGEQSRDPTLAYKRLGGRSKNLSRHFRHHPPERS
jgi:hypothetical protein